MSIEVRAFNVTVPAGTSVDSPQVTDVSFPARQVDVITVQVPPGPSGTVGFRILNSGLTVLPYDSADWIVTDNEIIQWPLTGQITSGSWQVAAYNTGAYDHTLSVRFALSLPPAPGTAGAIQPISTDLLDSLGA